jgi:putative membrane protein
MQYLNSLAVLASDPDNAWVHHHGFWPWAPLFFGFWILLFTAVGVMVWLVARRGFGARFAAAQTTGVERARSILAERFARGEIDAEEYDERLAHLSYRPPENEG